LMVEIATISRITERAVSMAYGTVSPFLKNHSQRP
jgi:hypothetical protein